MSATLERPATPRLKRIPMWKMASILFRLKRGKFRPAVANSYTVPDAFESYLGRYRVIFVHHPDLVESVLVKNHKSYHKDQGYEGLRRILGKGLLTSEEQFHLRQRRMIQPAFHKKRIDSYADCMVALARARADQWKDGQQLDLHVEMMNVTLAIIAKTMFNADASADAARVAEALETLLAVQDIYNVGWLAKFFEAFPFPLTQKLHHALRDLDEIMYRYIAEHRAAPADTGDLLSMLLEVKYEDDGSGMPDHLLRDECLTLFLAGHETTAVALSWTWYLLSQHPDVEARLHAELDQVLQGRDATADDVERLPYTRMVFTESMRIYPPAYAVGRLAIEDTQLGPYPISKGDTVILSQYITHRQPEWFPDPEAFDPERWAAGGPAASLPKFAYFPFGGGVRKCIGESFAWMEGILLLATFAQHWRARPAPGFTLALSAGVTLRPKHGMPMTLQKRA